MLNSFSASALSAAPNHIHDTTPDPDSGKCTRIFLIRLTKYYRYCLLVDCSRNFDSSVFRKDDHHYFQAFHDETSAFDFGWASQFNIDVEEFPAGMSTDVRVVSEEDEENQSNQTRKKRRNSGDAVDGNAVDRR